MKIGVVLSGSGFKDGSEIREAVLTLLAISKLGAEALCIAPDVMQTDVTNNLSGKPANEKRNVLVESARIARGQIKSTKEVNPNEIDALIFPGGYGVAKNLSTFAKDGAGCRVEPSVEVLTKRIHEQGKPLGFICIAPAMAAKIFEGKGIALTIGDDPATAKQIEQMGQRHEVKGAREVCIDKKNKIVSTPAYMCDAKLSDIAAGIERLVAEVISLIPQSVAK